MTIDPLEFEVRVQCTAEHAFRCWTEKLDAWWPKNHTSTGDPNTVVIVEAGEGGRIFERTPDYDEHQWGWVTRWDPPSGFSFAWHIGGEPRDATDVEITFTADGDQTIVRVVHHGWDRFGTEGTARREANHRGWTDLVHAFESHMAVL